jgi:hypothetical protein
MKVDVIVIGAGAAGLFCASIAARRGRSVLILEHADKPGKKILISGGGRCNFTNLQASPENYLCSNPGFHKSALARYTPADFLSLVEKYRIRYYEKKLGQLFCQESATQIVKMLMHECEAGGARIHLNCIVREISKTDHFTVTTSQGTYQAESVVIATGGLSIPKMGATDFGYRIARQFGLRIVEPRPGLVPLTLPENELRIYRDLSGVSVDALVSCRKQTFRENILLTHKGLSGPAILQISSYWKRGESISINLLPDEQAYALLQDNQRESFSLSTLLGAKMPQRFARAWTEAALLTKPMKQYSLRELQAIAGRLHQWNLKPQDTEGFGKAEVTAGGVNTDDLSSKTMESRQVPGLYFIGEIVDVTGWLGGYNFQWAWASGFAAGSYV